MLFFEHSAEKIWGFAGGQIDHNFLTLHGFASPLEVIAGALNYARAYYAFHRVHFSAGKMAVGYFDHWAGKGFFPIGNGGEEAVIFCFTYLWLVTAGAGAWIFDQCGLAVGAVLRGRAYLTVNGET